MKTVRSDSCLVIQTCVPDYRISVFRELVGERPDISVASGLDYFSTGLATASQAEAWWVPLRNRFLFGRRFLWQSGVIQRSQDAETVVVEWNPRILSTWVLLVIRRLAGRRTLLWGHIVSRQPTLLRPGAQWLRERMAWLADGMVTYTRADADLLRARLPGMPIWAAPNSNISRGELDGNHWTAEPFDTVCIGRLIKDKKPALLLDAWLRIRERLPIQSRLVFVGAGPERPVIETRALAAGVSDRVIFVGHVSDRDNLRVIFGRALVCVSAGYVGLAAIQSLAHGVPLLIADGEPHSPEIESCIAGYSAEFFTSDRPESLAEKLLGFYTHRAVWLARRAELIEFVRQRYTIEAMVAGLVEAAGGGHQRQRAVLVWEQFGPYHLARLRAVQQADPHWQFFGLEVATRSDTYAWERTLQTETVHCLESKKRASDLQAVTVYRRALRFFRKARVDVVFVTSYWPQSSVAVLLAARRAGAAVVVMTDSHAHTSRAQGVSRWVKHSLIRSFDAGLLAGQPQIKFFADLGLPRDRLFDGYDVVDNNYFSQRAEQCRGESAGFRRPYGLPDRYFLNIGRMVAKKDLPTLISAYIRGRELYREIPKLVLVGDGAEKVRLREQCRKAGLVIADMEGVTKASPSELQGADVYFYGFRQVDELPIFYSHATAFVLPSQWEEWGLVVNEAMASSVPVIVSAVAGCSTDLIVEGVTGFTFSPGDEKALAAILLKFARDGDVTHIGAAARAHIAQWDLDRFAGNARLAADAALGKITAATVPPAEAIQS